MWKKEFVIHKGAIPKEMCDQLVLKYKQLPAVEAAVGGEKKINKKIRSSKIRWISDTGEHNPIFDLVWRYARLANKQFGFHIDSCDALQFSEYDAKTQGKYESHIDTFLINDKTTHRKISMVVQLSDPDTYEGGDFKIHNTYERVPEHAMKGQGNIIFFPSIYYHEAMQVTSGVRYSLVGWFEGPKWK
jgi:PKHD-type hydroxylase